MLKKIFALLFLFTLYSISGYGQNISHYEKIVNTTPDKQKKLTALDSLLKRTYSKDTDAFIKYSLQYIDLAQELDSIEPVSYTHLTLPTSDLV